MTRSLALGALLVLAAPAVLLANMADPYRPGDAIGEPSAELAGLVVEHESLRVDLREQTVEAVYTVRNDSTAREVALEFLALGLVEVLYDSIGVPILEGGEGLGYTVEIDGRPVEAEAVRSLLVPSAWVTGDVRTPEIGGGFARYQTRIPPVYGAAPEDTVRVAPGFRFRLLVPEGPSTIRVAYPVELARYDDPSHPSALHQFAYSLAPARRWGGVGRLDVEVLLPPGVEVASTPTLAREGDRLTASFDGIPADVLTVAFRDPAPVTFRLGPVLAWVWAALCLLVAPAVWAKRRGRSRVLPSLGRALLAGVAAVAGFAAFMLLATAGSETAYGYGLVFGLFFLALPGVGIGMILYVGVEQVAGRFLSPRHEEVQPDRSGA